MLGLTRAYGLTLRFCERDSVIGGSLKTIGEFARPLLDFRGRRRIVPGGCSWTKEVNIAAIALPFAGRALR